MKVTVDTNVLVRAVMGDDEDQARAAGRLLREAEVIAITLPTLCEFVWVLRRRYRLSVQDVGTAIRTLIDTRNVAVNRAAVEFGLAVLEAGGDFADAVIAHEGEWLGGEEFVSFDQDAVALVSERGLRTRLLA